MHWDNQNIDVIILKFEEWFYNALMHPNDTEGMTNSVDLYQSTLLEAV